jgi:hypothetical protein
VTRSSVSFPFLLALLLLTGNAEAGNADYRRAKALAQSDPLEAEALYERFMRETPNGKIRRAANYDLFYLRLRNARLVEAFAQSANKEFGRKFSTAVADAYGISEAQASGLVRRLRLVCAEEEDVSRLGDYLRQGKMPAPVWDFALRVMLRCGVKSRSQIFAPDLFELERPTRLQTALRLIAVREQLFVDPERASELFAITRTAAQEQHAADEQLHMQLALLEARIAAAQEDYDSAIALCNALATEEEAKPVKSACDLLVAHALLKQGDAANAWKRIRRVPVNPTELDTRLLRLTVAVAAGVEKPEALVRFGKRASYAYCARSLRELAGSVLAQKNPK